MVVNLGTNVNFGEAVRVDNLPKELADMVGGCTSALLIPIRNEEGVNNSIREEAYNILGVNYYGIRILNRLEDDLRSMDKELRTGGRLDFEVLKGIIWTIDVIIATAIQAGYLDNRETIDISKFMRDYLDRDLIKLIDCYDTYEYLLEDYEYSRTSLFKNDIVYKNGNFIVESANREPEEGIVKYIRDNLRLFGWVYACSIYDYLDGPCCIGDDENYEFVLDENKLDYDNYNEESKILYSVASRYTGFDNNLGDEMFIKRNGKYSTESLLAIYGNNNAKELDASLYNILDRIKKYLNICSENSINSLIVANLGEIGKANNIDIKSNWNGRYKGMIDCIEEYSIYSEIGVDSNKPKVNGSASYMLYDSADSWERRIVYYICDCIDANIPVFVYKLVKEIEEVRNGVGTIDDMISYIKTGVMPNTKYYRLRETIEILGDIMKGGNIKVGTAIQHGEVIEIA